METRWCKLNQPRGTSRMILLYLPVSAAYLAAAWLEWQRLLQPATTEVPRSVAIAPWMTAFALIGHAYLVAVAIVAVDGLDLSLANVLSAVAGLTALFAWLGSLTRSLPGAAVVALPVAALATWLPLLFANPHRFSVTHEPWAALHIAIALAAYALLIVAAMQALILMGLEKRLHRGLTEPDGVGLPPLLTLERFLFRIVGAGYALLTLTLVTGV